MTSERFRQIRSIFYAAAEIDPATRREFVREQCRSDGELRQEVESMLVELEVEAPNDRLSAGTKLEKYEIVQQIGKGGMGEVYRAHDSALAREVAIKVLPRAMAEKSEFLDRIKREAKTLASLQHNNIARIYHSVEADGIFAIVMELVTGETLLKRLSQHRLPVEQALHIGVQVAETLAYAHQKGIIHRDIKPGNIMITPEGTVKVLDFGLAKVVSPVGKTFTTIGAKMGTPGYMAPEQIGGKKCDARTDLFALGLVLHEMLTGQRAFDPSGQASPITPKALELAVKRCLEQDPNQRWQTAAALRDELDHLKTGRINLTRRRWIGAGLTLAAGASVVTTGVWVARPKAPAKPHVPYEKSDPEYIFRGHVHDEHGDPVADAVISANGASAISKRDGTFALTLASDPGQTVKLAISRPGYRQRHIDNADFQVPDFGITLERDP